MRSGSRRDHEQDAGILRGSPDGIDGLRRRAAGSPLPFASSLGVANVHPRPARMGYRRPGLTVPWPWQLNAWPNVMISVGLLAFTFRLAWRTGRSPIGLVSRQADLAFVQLCGPGGRSFEHGPSRKRPRPGSRRRPSTSIPCRPWCTWNRSIWIRNRPIWIQDRPRWIHHRARWIRNGPTRA